MSDLIDDPIGYAKSWAKAIDGTMGQHCLESLLTLNAELEAEVKRWQQQSNKHYLYSCELDKTVADLNAELAPLEGRSAVDHMKYQGELETKVVNLTKERDKLRELLYDAYELGQTDAAGNGTLAGVAYKDKKQVTAALLQESSDE